MFEHYTHEARTIVFSAKQRASETGATEVGLEHILFALLQNDAAWGQAIKSREHVQRDLPERTAEVREPISPGDLPLSAEALRVLTFVSVDAAAANTKEIDGAHLLMGLTRAEGTWVADLLRRNGLTPQLIQPGVATHITGRSLWQRGSHWLRRFRWIRQARRISSAEDLLGDVIALAGKGRNRAALKLIDDVIADPAEERDKRIRLLAPLGVTIAYSMGDYATAKRYCETDLAQNPQSLVSLYGMAAYLDSMGEHEEARKYAKRCRQLAQEAPHQGNEGVVELLEKQFPGMDSKGGS